LIAVSTAEYYKNRISGNKKRAGKQNEK